MHWRVVGELSHKSTEKVSVFPWPCAGLLKRTCGVLLRDVSSIWAVSVAAFRLSGCRAGLCMGDGTAFQMLSAE